MGKNARKLRTKLRKLEKFVKGLKQAPRLAVDIETVRLTGFGAIPQNVREIPRVRRPLPVEKEINAFVTGTGEKLVNTHPREPRCDEGCVIHNPTDRTGFKTHWRMDRRLMERVCSHGVGHPDPDHIRYVISTRGFEEAEADAVHGCDGCCSPNKQVFKEIFNRG